MDSSPAPPSPAPPPIPPRRKRRQGNNAYYLQDHPVLVPVLTLLLGGLCVWAAILSHTLRDLLIGPHADRASADNFATANGWIVAFVIALMFLALVYLLWYGLETAVRAARRRPLVCPRCGAAEVPRTVRF